METALQHKLAAECGELNRDCLRLANKRLKRLHRVYSAAVSAWLRRTLQPALLIGLLVLNTTTDYQVFKSLGLPLLGTVLVALGLSLTIAFLGDVGIGARLHLISARSETLRSGLRWRFDTWFAATSITLATATAIAVAWVRARQLAPYSDLGIGTPSMGSAFALFAFFGLALTTAAALIGWNRAARQHAPTQRPRPGGHRRHRVEGLIARIEHDVHAFVEHAKARQHESAARLQAQNPNFQADLNSLEIPYPEPLRTELDRIRAPGGRTVTSRYAHVIGVVLIGGHPLWSRGADR